MVGDVDVGREQRLVGAGLEGEDGHAVVAVLGAHAGHVEGVGDDHAVEAEFAAQHALQDGGRQGGRLVAGVERGDLEVRGHDRVDAGGDRGPEGRGVDAVPLLAGVLVITGSPVWLSCPVSPWPGKCLAQATTPVC
ncbi:hypothetical protein STENM327S_00237 [Streptomyces tendae]